MKESSKKSNGIKKMTENNTFTVPLASSEIKENITITTNTSSNLSKEQIINQAIKYNSQGKYKEAAKYYKIFIDKGYKDYRVFSNYGSILKSLRKLKEAEIATRKAIELNPNFAIAHSNLGGILKDLGKVEEAEVSTRKAIELNPDYALAHSNLGSILNDLGKVKEAEVSTRKAIKLNPNIAKSYNNLGTILTGIGRLKEAEIFYSKAISLEPNYEDAHINRGKLFFDNKEFEKALRDSDSCNSKNSRAFSLEILYSLGRIKEIYNRIENSAGLDSDNIRLAAFSSFISESQNKETCNNFCPKPLSFLHFNNLKFHVKEYKEFIKEIINELSDIKTIWEPSNKATHNGFQTPSHINLFSNPSEKISYLITIILNELNSYFKKFENESCTYIQKWPFHKNLKAWHVILKKQGYQSAHIHPAGWLSGVIYLKVVPPLKNNEGAIEFSLNGENYFNVNSPQLIHQPEAGDIILFPSSLHHRTIPFSTDTKRIVIAFDLIQD